MKRLLTLLLAMASFSAVSASASDEGPHAYVHNYSRAYSSDMSWDEIMRNPILQPKAPTVYMGRSIDYMFVCVDGDRLRTLKPVGITETRTYGDRQEVVEVDRQYLSTPINYKHTVEDCFWNTNQRICKDVVVRGSYPLTVSIPVYRHLFANKNDRLEYLFRKTYTVPSCDDSVQPH
ncbi:hypothetical protein [Bdellovibrio bacteriovorus]|uniref:hypothetical protein n=1 Tax=Bdellovibrio bacteriovorus TaxID=959 RepID=UPI0035A5CF36